MSALVEQLKQEFSSNKEYRHSYAEEFLNASIATQIKVLRELRKWRQSDLARESNMKQSVISRLENVDYSSWSIKSLKQLARAFDVRLIVRFERFRNLVLEADKFNRKLFEVPVFAEDKFFKTEIKEEPLRTPVNIELSITTSNSFGENLAVPMYLVAAAETAKNSEYQMAAGV